jgi:hypothetical protein
MLLARVIFDFETPASETEFNLNYLFPSPLRAPLSLILYREIISFFFAGIICNAYRMYVFLDVKPDGTCSNHWYVCKRLFYLSPSTLK